MEFNLGPCSNCGTQSFHQIEDTEHPYILFIGGAKDDSGTWKPSSSKAMPVAVYTCTNCRQLKLFEPREK